MTNSAHDNITVLVTDDEVDALKERLDRLAGCGLPNVYNLLKLINKLHRQNVPAEVKNYELKLFNKTYEKLYLHFEYEQLTEKGWLTEFPMEDFPCHEKPLTELHLQAIAEGQYELSFAPPSEKSSVPALLTLEQLLKKMDAFSVGRPSTYARIFTEMMDHGFLVVDQESMTVHITKAAYEAFEVLQRHEEKSWMKARFSSELAKCQQDIESEQLSVSQALSNIAREVLTERDAKRAIAVLWQDINELYDDSGQDPDKAMVSTFVSQQEDLIY